VQDSKKVQRLKAKKAQSGKLKAESTKRKAEGGKYKAESNKPEAKGKEKSKSQIPYLPFLL
jgi:hypothetical protein